MIVHRVTCFLTIDSYLEVSWFLHNDKKQKWEGSHLLHCRAPVNNSNFKKHRLYSSLLLAYIFLIKVNMFHEYHRKNDLFLVVSQWVLKNEDQYMYIIQNWMIYMYPFMHSFKNQLTMLSSLVTQRCLFVLMLLT